MKYKMTVLYYSKAGNAEALARAIAREQQTKGDQIPPAYPCEAQKLLLMKPTKLLISRSMRLSEI